MKESDTLKAILTQSIAMEWTIPLQSFDTSKVRISGLHKSQKPMANLSYADGELQLPALSILLPSLPIKSYDVETGRLALSLHGSQSFLTKLSALQTFILNTAYTNYRTWFPGERDKTYEDISTSFQPLIHNSCLYLYCPLSTSGSFNEIQVYSGGTWTRGTVASGILTGGKQIRIAVRLQGLSFHQHPITKALTGKSRVQHRILAIYAD
jgi:hypothetical protein